MCCALQIEIGVQTLTYATAIARCLLHIYSARAAERVAAAALAAEQDAAAATAAAAAAAAVSTPAAAAAVAVATH
jgi:hypothetical protein